MGQILLAGRSPRIFLHLLQMCLHRLSHTHRIAMLQGFQNLFVVILSALRPSFHEEKFIRPPNICLVS